MSKEKIVWKKKSESEDYDAALDICRSFLPSPKQKNSCERFAKLLWPSMRPKTFFERANYRCFPAKTHMSKKI